MTAFLQTSDGDLALSTGVTPGRFTLIDGDDEKAQKIANRLDLFVGEWFLDLREGVPYYEAILGQKNPRLELIKRIFRRAIMSVEGIADVDIVMTFDKSARELDWSATATTDEGVEISGGLGKPFIVERG